jgi:tape measure domain-containing protein
VGSVFAVDIEFRAKGAQQLQQFNRQAEELKRTVEGTKIDALNSVIGVLPGRAGAAANGILSLNRGLRDAQDQAKATAQQYRAMGAEIAAIQALINRKQIQLGAKGGIGGESLKREIGDLQQRMKGMEDGAAGVAAASGASVMAMAALGVAVAGVAVGLGALTGAAVKFTNEIDRNRQQLTLFTKDVQVTNQIIASLQRTADTTSLGLPGLLEATKTMSAYGIEAKNAGAATKMLGDLALGDNEKLQRFAVNFAQISSLGRAYTVDLKQFGMAGIPIFDALSKTTGKTTAEVMKMAEEGKITYPLVVKALQDLTKEGASFYKGAERGGTDLDRATQQMLGSWEKLQQKVGTAVAPAIVKAINGIAEALNGVLALIDATGSAISSLRSGPLGQMFDFALDGLKQIARFIDENPLLLSILPGGSAVGGALSLRAFGKTKSSGGAEDEAERARLAADAQRKAEIDAKAEAAKLQEATARQVAKLNQDTERSLAEARIGYEQQVADFRRQQLEKIADMERTLADERRSEEFKLAQLQASNASKERLGQIDSQILDARIGGRDTTALETARAIEVDKETAARKRAEIEFNATTRKIELERRLTDFKRESERAMGEMQLAYSRQTGGILRQAGQAVGDLMKKGALESAEILKAAGVSVGQEIAQAINAANGAAATGQLSGGAGGTQGGGDFSKWRPDLLLATSELDKKYKLPQGTTASLVMFESSGNTAARGPDVGGGDRGHGLFQIMRGTARELGVDHNSIRKMGGVEQMRLLDKYWQNRGFKPGMSPEQAYATVLGGNPWAKSADLNGTTPGSGANAQRRWRPAAARAIQAAEQTRVQQTLGPTAPGGVFANPMAGIFEFPKLGAPVGGQQGPNRVPGRPIGQKAISGGLPVVWNGFDYVPDPSAQKKAPTPTPTPAAVASGARAPAAAAANNIVPTGSIPTTSPELQASTDELQRLNASAKLDLQLQQEREQTAQIREAMLGITLEQESQLKSAEKKNAIDLRTLELMRSGITPELAAQQAANEKLIEGSIKGLESQKMKVQNALDEKGITEKTRLERQKLLDQINAQIARQPKLLEDLNEEAKLTQKIANGRKIADKVAQMKAELEDTQGMIVSLAGTVESELGSAMSNAISGVISGTTTVQQAFSQMFANIGQSFIQMATQMIAKALIMKALGILGGSSGGLFSGGASVTGGGFGDFSGGSFGVGSSSLDLGGLGGSGALAGAYEGIKFAEGGFVTGTTNAVIGEGGENEYVIPESKMSAAMQRYSAGSRGSAVIPGSGESGGGGETGGVSTIDVSYRVTEVNSIRYVDEATFQAGMRQAAEQGAAAGHRRVFGDLRNSRSQRSRVGLAR